MFCFSEIQGAIEQSRKQENELTNALQKHCKIVLLSNRLNEAIDRNVRFKAR